MKYSYNKFLSDSSDDEKFVISQADDDMNYQQAYSQTEVGVALVNVLGLARERLEQLSETENFRQSNRESMQIVKDYFFNSEKTAKNDKDK